MLVGRPDFVTFNLINNNISLGRETVMKCLALVRAITLLAVSVSAVSLPSVHAQTARPAVETFFKHGAFSGAALSPDARFLAVRIAPKAQSHSLLAVIDLATFK